MTTIEELLIVYSQRLLEACENDGEKDRVQNLVNAVETTKSAAQIKRLLLKFTTENLILNRLLFDCFKSINDLPKQVLQARAREYFQRIYPGSTVSFFQKSNGVQLGSIAEVTTNQGEKIKFYIKTHRKGLLTQASSTAESVEITEVFLYRLLELLGIGPEVHFFYESPREFYICTRDAGDVDSISSMKFVTFSAFRENEETKKVVENVRTMDSDLEDIDHETYQFMLAIVTIDIVCRLFDMDDVLKNADNFGFILNSRRVEKFCIIDFSPTSFGTSGADVFEGITKGNGVFLHSRDSEPAFRYIFCNRPVDKRLELGRKAFHQLGDLREYIIRAYSSVEILVSNNEELSVQLFELNRKLRIWQLRTEEFRQLLQEK